jgi:hypothetical protein
VATSYYQMTNELVTSIPITRGVYNPTVVYSVAVGNISTNDILKITNITSLLNNYTYEASVSCFILLGTSATDTVGVATLSPVSVSGISPVSRYAYLVKARQWQATTNYSGSYVNIIVYAQNPASNANDVLQVTHKAGHLDVVIN